MSTTTVQRQFIQDRYNPDKTWEVVTLSGGFYLRQYIKGRQFGRGARVTKQFLQNIGILKMAADYEEIQREHYRANQDKIEAAREAGLPLLDYGGHEACWSCGAADHDTMTGEDDDICCVICHNPNCPQQQKGR